MICLDKVFILIRDINKFLCDSTVDRLKIFHVRSFLMLRPKKTNKYTYSACATNVECLKWENTQNSLIYDEVGSYDHVQAIKKYFNISGPNAQNAFFVFSDKFRHLVVFFSKASVYRFFCWFRILYFTFQSLKWCVSKVISFFRLSLVLTL